MMTSRTCPKCHTGKMYTIGGGCNYRCELCGHTYYEAPPRVRVSHGASDRMREITRECRQTSREFDATMRELKEAGRELDRARKAQKQQCKTQKKQEKKGSGLGTVIGVLFILWLLSQFLA
ncbi:MAG: hypothetical protein HFG00_06210 [Oscillibacter sp.]|nr:hypothetical protein [Oscillibacter sp.]